jgi:hypothetical protein
MKIVVVDDEKARRRLRGIRSNQARIVRLERPRLSEHPIPPTNPGYGCRD